ncbi:MAG: hypothetical protein RMI83_00325 [Desulfurococcaceae archaeon]|nr:hypothetical protein [Sulfolobales archaeon]MDW8169547.1 hypothetical protein [Desulfurococcaceae archaeon]
MKKCEGLLSKFFAFLSFEECKRAIVSLSLRNRGIVRDYTKAFMQFANFIRESPSELVKLSYEYVLRLMEDSVLRGLGNLC